MPREFKIERICTEQLVIQPPGDKIVASSLREFWLNPKTCKGISSAPVVDNSTFLAPDVKCFSADSFLMNCPLHSNTTSTFRSLQGKAIGSLCWYAGISMLSTFSELPEELMV